MIDFSYFIEQLDSLKRMNAIATFIFFIAKIYLFVAILKGIYVTTINYLKKIEKKTNLLIFGKALILYLIFFGMFHLVNLQIKNDENNIISNVQTEINQRMNINLTKKETKTLLISIINERNNEQLQNMINQQINNKNEKPLKLTSKEIKQYFKH